MTAPVQVLVVGFDESTFTGEVLAELTRLREAGVVRLVDVLLLSRDAEGNLETLPPPPGAEAGLGRIAAELLALPDGGDDAPTGSDGDTWSLDGAVPPGSTGAVALIEHLWAEPLVASIRRAGGQLLDETWLAPDDVERLGKLTAPTSS